MMSMPTRRRARPANPRAELPSLPRLRIAMMLESDEPGGPALTFVAGRSYHGRSRSSPLTLPASPVAQKE